jgi:hypothetical protein
MIHMATIRKWLAALAASAAAVSAVSAGTGSGVPTSDADAGRCDRAATPNGTEGAAGTTQRPFATVQRLVDALRPGQTGCLLAGRYQGNIVIRAGGTAHEPITLRALSRAPVTILGWLDWEPGGRYWRVTGVRIHSSGSAAATVQIHGDGVRLDHDEITNQNLGGDCITIGNLRYGVTHGTIVDHDRIHDCGAPGPEPFHHGVYVCCGYGARITNNYIWHSTGRGVQLYPDADGALVAHNVIDGNVHRAGVTFGGDPYGSCFDTNDGTVTNNIITHNGRYAIDDWWGCRVGSGNVVTRNCFWANGSGSVPPDAEGFTASANLTADPRFVALKQHDYRLRAGSPCARMHPRGSIGP